MKKKFSKDKNQKNKKTIKNIKTDSEYEIVTIDGLKQKIKKLKVDMKVIKSGKNLYNMLKNPKLSSILTDNYKYKTPNNALTLDKYRDLLKKYSKQYSGSYPILQLRVNYSDDNIPSNHFKFLPTGYWEIFDVNSDYHIYQSKDMRDNFEKIKAINNPNNTNGYPAYEIFLKDFQKSDKQQYPNQFVYCQGMAQLDGEDTWKSYDLQVCDENYFSSNCIDGNYISLDY